MSGQTDARLLLLHEGDNVVVVTRRLRAGETVLVAGRMITLEQDLPLGHKLACHDIQAAAHVLKYGAPIGSATRHIAVGEHVHVHNNKSDYTPSYHLTDGLPTSGGAS